MLPALTRGQKILAAVAVLIIALFVTGVATQDGSGASPDPTQNGLVKTLGRWFGSPDAVAVGELSASCLADGKLTISGTCVLTVKPADKDLRELKLRPDKPLHLRTRAPHDDTVIDKDVAADEEIKVAVDDKGADITLTCEKCVVKVGGSDG